MARFYPLFVVIQLLLAVSGLSAQELLLTPLAASFDRPVDIKHAGDERIFVVEKAGRIQIMNQQGEKFPAPFLDISGLVNSGASERGLLGLAFHPEYAGNGYFFVHYTGAGGHSRISRFTRSASNPNQADPASELVLLLIQQPFNNHNAGDLAFGPDGYLYIPMGDGGSGGDPGNRSQHPKELLGKMLRIDVDSGSPYAIPADNPFAGNPDTLPEIWALGLRNPWRISFDRLTGDLWIADVGQGNWEEINMEPAGSTGGKNWGWRCYEGFAPFNLAGCGPAALYDPPVFVYPNTPSVGCSVTGGYVYRGSQHPSLYGKYLYTDYCSGRIWTLQPDGSGGWSNEEIFKGLPLEYVAFGEDQQGELYLAALGEGKIFRLSISCAFQAQVLISPESCPGTCDGSFFLQPEAGCPPYHLELIASDGNAWNKTDSLWTDLCPDTYTLHITDCTGCRLETTVLIEEAPVFPLQLFWSGDTLLATGGMMLYRWFREGAEVAQTTLPFLVPDSSGLYSVEALDPRGCLAFSNEVLVELPVSLDQPGGHEWVIFPNPFSHYITLKSAVHQTGRLRMLDVHGQVVAQTPLSLDERSPYQWNLPTDLPEGLYFMNWQGDDGFFQTIRMLKFGNSF